MADLNSDICDVIECRSSACLKRLKQPHAALAPFLAANIPQTSLGGFCGT